MLFSNFECIVMVANAATMLEEPTGFTTKYYVWLVYKLEFVIGAYVALFLYNPLFNICSLFCLEHRVIPQ